MRNWKWYQWLGVTLVTLVALVLIFNGPLSRWLAGSQRVQVEKPRVERSLKNYDYGAIGRLNAAQVAKGRLVKHHFIGVIAMPALQLTVPISQGVTTDTLAVGAGTMRPNMAMGKGNYALAGHNMDDDKTLFSPLEHRAKPGQTIYISDMHRVYVYKVTTVKGISAKAINTVANTHEPLVTLITCNASGSARIMVRGHLTKTMSFKHASPAVQKLLVKNVTNRPPVKV